MSSNDGVQPTLISAFTKAECTSACKWLLKMSIFKKSKKAKEEAKLPEEKASGGVTFNDEEDIIMRSPVGSFSSKASSRYLFFVLVTLPERRNFLCFYVCRGINF